MGDEEKKRPVHVFMTMHANPEMSLWDWQRHCEELKIAVARAMPVVDWHTLAVYGPRADGFSTGSIAVQLRAPEAVILEITQYLAEQGEWFALPLGLHRIQEVEE